SARSKDAASAHAVAAAAHAADAGAAVSVTDSAGERIGRIGGRDRRQREQAPDHLLHLLLRGLAVTDDRLLDLQRRVFADRKLGENCCGDRRAARLTEQQGRLRIDIDKDFFDRDLGWKVRADDGGKVAHDQLEPIGQLARGVAYAAAGYVLKAVAGANDYSKT